MTDELALLPFEMFNPSCIYLADKLFRKCVVGLEKFQFKLVFFVLFCLFVCLFCFLQFAFYNKITSA